MSGQTIALKTRDILLDPNAAPQKANDEDFVFASDITNIFSGSVTYTERNLLGFTSRPRPVALKTETDLATQALREGPKAPQASAKRNNPSLGL